MQLLLDGIRPIGIVQVAIDPAGALGPLGALRDDEIVEGLGTLRDDLLTPLGAAVVCRGGRPGHVSMRVTVHRVGWRSLGPIEVRPGQLEVVPLPRGQVAELEIELDPGVSLGAPRRARRMRASVSGGAVGVVLDARDAPLLLPRRSDDRRAVLGAWRDTFAARGPAADRGGGMIEASLHRIHLPRGTVVSARVGAEIKPDEVIGLRRGAPWRRSGFRSRARSIASRARSRTLLVVRPGERVEAEQPLALVEGGGVGARSRRRPGAGGLGTGRDAAARPAWRRRRR